MVVKITKVVAAVSKDFAKNWRPSVYDDFYKMFLSLQACVEPFASWIPSAK
jgi:hypothetical protein